MCDSRLKLSTKYFDGSSHRWTEGTVFQTTFRTYYLGLTEVYVRPEKGQSDFDEYFETFITGPSVTMKDQ